MTWDEAFDNYRKAVERNIVASKNLDTAKIEKEHARSNMIHHRNELRAIEQELLNL